MNFVCYWRVEVFLLKPICWEILKDSFSRFLELEVCEFQKRTLSIRIPKLPNPQIMKIRSYPSRTMVRKWVGAYSLNRKGVLECSGSRVYLVTNLSGEAQIFPGACTHPPLCLPLHILTPSSTMENLTHIGKETIHYVIWNLYYSKNDKITRYTGTWNQTDTAAYNIETPALHKIWVEKRGISIL